MPDAVGPCHKEATLIRLTVFYNLLPDDEDEFLRWRMGDHRDPAAAMPGVLRSDFGQVTESPTPGQGRAPNPLPFRFMTVAEWDTREEFERSFHDEGLQTQFKRIVGKTSKVLFLVSEILTGTDKRKEAS